MSIKCVCKSVPLFGRRPRLLAWLTLRSRRGDNGDTNREQKGVYATLYTTAVATAVAVAKVTVLALVVVVVA